MKISVLLDVYPNYFPEDASLKYVYHNIRAVVAEEQILVDKCIEKIKKEYSSLFFEDDLILCQDIKPIALDKKAWLNLIDNKIEFE